MNRENNKLEPYVRSQGLQKRLTLLEDRSPSLFKVVEGLIIAVGKPMMAVRAGFYHLTGGVFANSNVPWFRILLIVVAAYVLTKKNLYLNFNLNAPNSVVTQPTEATKMGINQSWQAVAPTLDDNANRRYIQRFAKTAKGEMAKFGLPASVLLAQGLLESQAGSTDLAKRFHNHFNIRCGSFESGVCAENENGIFYHFSNAWEGWRANSELLTNGKYAALMKFKNDYKKWAEGLESLGYSTDSQYAEKLVYLIENYDLTRFDAL